MPLNTLEYHVLLALAAGPIYGYAIKDAIAAESGGTLEPRAGSLYRVLARLMSQGLVLETRGPEASHPGLARRYYALSAAGRTTLAEESQRLKRAVHLAERRLRMAPGRS